MSADSGNFQDDVRGRTVAVDSGNAVDHPMSVGSRLRAVERRFAIQHSCIGPSLEEGDQIVEVLVVRFNLPI